MTLRQVLDVLWKRKWIIVSVVAIALVTAAAYLQIRTETFTSTGALRLNAVVTDAAYSGEIGGVSVDIDPDVILSPAVLDPAADELGVDSAALGGSIDISVDAESRLAQVSVTAEAGSPAAAQDYVSAVLSSFQAYIDAQVAAALQELQEAQTTATATARELQQAVAQNPADSISQANLQTALQRMTSATAAIDTINTGGANTIVLRQPSAGASTVPGAIIVMLLALLTGLIIGIAVALIRDQFDNRLRAEDEVEELTGARSIGELSWDRKLQHMDPPLPVASNERTDLSERLRTLRSNLAVFLPSREAAFVVTSVEPGDGKSFVSANLALAWARAGKKVILVGGDLRRPNLARYFGDAADGEGLSDILQEHEVGEELSIAAVESRLNSTRYRRLMVLPAGPEPSEPADLFARPVISDVIAYLRMLADVVIIDSPPAIGMADAALLASHTDGAIVLATIRKTDRVRLLETLEALRAAGTEVLGVVSNRSRRKLPKSYSSYYVTGSKAEPTTPALSPSPTTGELELDEFDDDEAPLRRSRAADVPPVEVDLGSDEDEAADIADEPTTVQGKGRKTSR
ncbi:MAG: polysaccharide biosynthesis tyrosine autokinase [Microbacterium sp.]